MTEKKDYRVFYWNDGEEQSIVGKFFSAKQAKGYYETLKHARVTKVKPV